MGSPARSYPGEPSSRSYTIDLVDESQPTSVQLNGQTLASSAWSYNSADHTLQVPVGAVATDSTATITQTGGTPVTLSEPTAPVITFTSPATAAAGQQVTVTGSGFGATQGSSYLTFSDNGTNWGAPPDQASFTIDSWSDSAITFTVPQPSGTNGQWAVTPGTTAHITVTTSAGTSNTTGVAITSATPPTAITGYEGLCLTTAAPDHRLQPDPGLHLQQHQRPAVEVSHGTLQVLGKCLDVNGGTTTNGTVVDLYDCNGTAAQTWSPQPNGALVNPQSGKCLTDTNSGGSGTQASINDCNGQSNQHWTLP